MRSKTELLQATRPHARESRARSWWALSSTFLLLGAVLVGNAFCPWLWLQIPGVLLAALLWVRLFVIYHDFLHGAILRKSRLAPFLFWPFGLVTLAPPLSWRDSHNRHHATNMRVGLDDLGSFPIWTTERWQQSSTGARLGYRIVRHPLTVLTAYLTVFVYGLCLRPLLENVRKSWDAGLALAIHVLLVVGITQFFGAEVLLLSFLGPLAVACAIGAFLFYAQHNFEGVQLHEPGEWSFTKAALQSSSYLCTGPVARWFTANIGFHHVHHLNPVIPFYNLPRAMQDTPELQAPTRIGLNPRTVVECFRLNLWDAEAGRMVAFGQAAANAR